MIYKVNSLRLEKVISINMFTILLNEFKFILLINIKFILLFLWYSSINFDKNLINIYKTLVLYI